jgi:hypothetical protein
MISWFNSFFIFMTFFFSERKDCGYEFYNIRGPFCHEIEKLCLSKEGLVFSSYRVERSESNVEKIGKWNWMNDSLIFFGREKGNGNEKYHYKRLNDISFLIPLSQKWQPVILSADSIIDNDPEILELKSLLKPSEIHGNDVLVKLKSKKIGRFFCKKMVIVFIGKSIDAY